MSISKHTHTYVYTYTNTATSYFCLIRTRLSRVNYQISAPLEHLFCGCRLQYENSNAIAIGPVIGVSIKRGSRTLRDLARATVYVCVLGQMHRVQPAAEARATWCSDIGTRVIG